MAPFPPVARLLQKSQAPPVRLHYGCPSCPEQILMRSRVPSSAPSRTWLEDQSRWGGGGVLASLGNWAERNSAKDAVLYNRRAN